MLNKDQKNLLEWLIKHPGWKLIKEIEEEYLNDLWRQLLSINVKNEKDLDVLRDKQIYATARKEFILSIENQSIDIQETSFDLW